MMGNQGKSEHITKTLWTQIMADHIWVFSELYMQWFIHESLPQTFTPWTDSLLTSTSLLNIKWEAFKNIMIDDDYIFSPGTSDWSCLTILKFEIKNPNVAKCSITIPSPSHANTLRQVSLWGFRAQGLRRSHWHWVRETAFRRGIVARRRRGVRTVLEARPAPNKSISVEKAVFNSAKKHAGEENM